MDIFNINEDELLELCNMVANFLCGDNVKTDDVLQPVSEFFGLDDVPDQGIDKDRSRATKRKNDYKKTKKRWNMADNVWGWRPDYVKINGKPVFSEDFGKFRDCLPTGHTERRPWDRKNHESKRRRQAAKKAIDNALYEMSAYKDSKLAWYEDCFGDEKFEVDDKDLKLAWYEYCFGDEKFEVDDKATADYYDEYELDDVENCPFCGKPL